MVIVLRVLPFYSLLIEPTGIEIKLRIIETVRSYKLLIEPTGIEINNLYEYPLSISASN